MDAIKDLFDRIDKLKIPDNCCGVRVVFYTDEKEYVIARGATSAGVRAQVLEVDPQKYDELDPLHKTVRLKMEYIKHSDVDANLVLDADVDKLMLAQHKIDN